MKLLRAFDIPPVWLCLAGLLGWGLAHVIPAYLPGARAVGATLMLMGAGLVMVAGGQMLWSRTSPWPRRVPGRLLTQGAFALSRNPIYLGDTMLLTGWLLLCGAAWSLPLVALFTLLITRRFILPEETQISLTFGPDWDCYRKQVRRWL